MKKHLPLIIGIALPIFIILVVLLFVWIPTTLVNPKYDFVFAAENRGYNERYQNRFEVTNGKLTLVTVTLPKREVVTYTIVDMPQLYMYEVETGAIRKISYDEARQMTLDQGPTSRDGYYVEYRNNRDGIFELLGSSDDDRGYFITKGTTGKRINFPADSSYYYGSGFSFIGWIK